MCGIAGFVGPNVKDKSAIMAAMSGSIEHRGPDDNGMWNDDYAFLVHRRLSIIDVSQAGHQPMISNCGRYILVYNGEIYNYIELRKELEDLGFVFSGQSDSEVLLAAFIAKGQNCVSHFNGMWAFAIWDKQSKRMFISRDRFGEKPFYYIIQNGCFWFASEIKALLATGIVGRSVNASAVADFAAERVSDHSERTFFADIFQLPPATSGWFDSGELFLHPYWNLPDDKSSDFPLNELNEIGSILYDAVRIRLRSDVDMGVLLSGGLDSSTVCCLAAKMVNGQIAAFSTIDTHPQEEAEGIDFVLAAYRNIILYRDTPPVNCLDQDLESCLWHQEEPFADGSMLAHFRLMRIARDQGVKVLLTGQGSDEVFAGYNGYLAIHFGSLIRSKKFTEAFSFLKSLRQTAQYLPTISILGYALPAGNSKWLRQFRVNNSLNWLNADWRQVSDTVSEGYTYDKGDSLNSALRTCIRQRTLPAFLHYEDRNSMAFGIETRIPYLDYRLVEKVLPLTGSIKLSGSRSKAILRDVVVDYVPSHITSKLTKQGYPAQLSKWLRFLPAAHYNDRLDLVSSCPMICFSNWHKRYQRFMNGYDAELPSVWRGLMLSMWYDRFIKY